MPVKLKTTVAVALTILLAQDARSAPTAVYDNTATLTSGTGAPNGFWPFNVFTANELMGDQIILAGTDRVVTEFDLLLRSSQPTTLTRLGFALYDLNSNGFPGNQLWVAPDVPELRGVYVDGSRTLAISVPYVEVPDELVWVAWADSNVAGLATCDPPATGSSPVFVFPPDVVYDYYWDLDTPSQTWMPLQFPGDDPVSNFGARVLAVPEPASMLVLAVGCLLAASRTRPACRPRR